MDIRTTNTFSKNESKTAYSLFIYIKGKSKISFKKQDYVIVIYYLS